jgi:hypothetical protein
MRFSLGTMLALVQSETASLFMWKSAKKPCTAGHWSSQAVAGLNSIPTNPWPESIAVSARLSKQRQMEGDL